jgi:hypothetical protein
MRLGERNRSASAPVTLCSPKIPYVLTWEQTKAATLEVVHPRNSQMEINHEFKEISPRKVDYN